MIKLSKWYRQSVKKTLCQKTQSQKEDQLTFVYQFCPLRWQSRWKIHLVWAHPQPHSEPFWICDWNGAKLGITLVKLLLNKHWIVWQWLLIYFCENRGHFDPSLCSRSFLPDYTDAFCFHSIICDWMFDWMCAQRSCASVYDLAICVYYFCGYLLSSWF